MGTVNKSIKKISMITEIKNVLWQGIHKGNLCKLGLHNLEGAFT